METRSRLPEATSAILTASRPTPEEREKHELTHAPFKPWCDICVAARSKEEPHKKIIEREGPPLVEMD